MPELPEVEAITNQVYRAVNRTISSVEVVRQNGKYLADAPSLSGRSISHVYRVGKRVVMELEELYLVTHNAMTGFFDWADRPWCFDYVEADRISNRTDVRVKFNFDDGLTMLFHDARMFGSMKVDSRLPPLVPEVVQTDHGHKAIPLMSRESFWMGLRLRKEPVKHVLMDQDFTAGIGNIYANEACFLASVDPAWPACSIPKDLSYVLYDALRATLLRCIPQINYGWLNVYRQQVCKHCGNKIYREELRGRATFSCPRCQWERP